MNIAHLLFRQARVHPEREAVSLGSQTLYNYEQLAQRTAVLAGQLRQQFALKSGDRVAIFMRNTPQYLEILYAIWTAGLVAVPINNKLHAMEAAYIIEHSQATLVFAGENATKALMSTPFAKGEVPIINSETITYQNLLTGEALGVADCVGADLAWLFYTSGTTGKPKGVMLSHQNLLTMTLCYLASVDSIAAQDSILYAAPMSHGAGMYNMAFTMMGGRHIIPASGEFDCAEIFNLSSQYQQISMFAAPTMVRRMVDYCAEHQANPAGIKTIIYGGGPMYLEDIQRGLAVMGNRFVQIYGQGESPMTITSLTREHFSNQSHPRYLERLASVGVAQSAVEVRIVDEEGNILPSGEVGEIVVRGATVMQGYWNNPSATAETLRDGWLYTGDMGVMDAEGFVTLKDRSKDVIITGGSNVYPREVEEVLLTHPSVVEVSVVGEPNQEWGENIVAFIVSHDEAFNPQALNQHCLAHIARFKRPKAYIQLERLPKNNYGKVLKTTLRENLATYDRTIVA